MKINPRDLTKSALQSIVEQLLTSDDATGRSIMRNLGRQARQKPPRSNDLADLHEEMHGKYDAPMVDDDDGDDDESDFDDDNGVQTARVQGPPSTKPARSRIDDEDDEDLPPPRRRGRASMKNDEDMPPAKKAPRTKRSDDEDLA